jgi:hypothetical protein
MSIPPLARILAPLLAASLAASAIASTSLAAQNAPGDVMAVVKRLFDGMRAGDSGMVRSVFHPKTRMISASSTPGGETRLNIESSVDDFVKAVGTPHPEKWDERIWNEKVQIDGPLASVWVDYGFFLGARFSHCGIDHFLLVKSGAGAGVWSIVELADTRKQEGCDVAKTK